MTEAPTICAAASRTGETVTETSKIVPSRVRRLVSYWATFPALIAVLLAASAAVSAVGSGLSLRRFLRV